MEDFDLSGVSLNTTDPTQPNYIDPSKLPEGFNAGSTAVTTAPTGTIPAAPTGTIPGDLTGGETPAVAAIKSSITNPTLPEGTQATPTLQTANADEQIDPGAFGVAAQPTVQAATVGTTQTGAAPVVKPAATYDATTSGAAPTVDTATADKLSAQSQVTAAQQDGISTELSSEFDTFQSELDAIGVDSNMTVQGQYSKLMDFGPNEIPSWAKGAYRTAINNMAARGISGSTIAGGAITTALMQAAMPIAQQDAKVFETLKLSKLDKKSQGVFLRAGYIAELDTTNLNNRMQAAVINSQSFLGLDMKNLDNRQQSAVVNTQSRLQKMLADNSAVNAARQFNATSINQVNEVYAALGADMEKFNASQANAMERFNAGETNSIAKFNVDVASRRDQFNSGQALVIEQSNTNYLRGINTANTAFINQSNMINSQNLLGISNTAMANEIQIWRDEQSFAFQASENEKDRANQMAAMAMQNEEWSKRYKTQQKGATQAGIGNFLFGVAETALGSWLDDDDDGGYTPSDANDDDYWGGADT